MMAEPKLTKEQMAWRGQDDARTLAAAEAIKSDPRRLKMAAQEATKMAEESQRRADALSYVAGQKDAKKVRATAKATKTKLNKARKPAPGMTAVPKTPRAKKAGRKKTSARK